MAALKDIKKKISEGKIVTGTVISFNDSSITEILGDLGYDFVWIDGEHSALERQAVQHHIMAARGTDAAPFVRIPWNDPVLAKPILEMGPAAIIFPFIRTAEEARLAVSSCLYPPDGIRGFGPRRANRYGMVDNDTYLKEYSSQIWKVMQIEHYEAVENLEEILAVEEVDTIVVGPNDLSGSIGLLGQTRHKEVIALMDEIGRKAMKSGKPFGVSMGLDPQSIRDWLRRGVSWIGVGGDTGHLIKGAKETLNETRDIIERG